MAADLHEMLKFNSMKVKVYIVCVPKPMAIHNYTTYNIKGIFITYITLFIGNSYPCILPDKLNIPNQLSVF